MTKPLITSGLLDFTDRQPILDESGFSVIETPTSDELEVTSIENPSSMETTERAPETALQVAHKDPFQATRLKHRNWLEETERKVADFITLPFNVAIPNGGGYKLKAKRFTNFLLNTAPAALAFTIHKVVDEKLRLGYLPLGTTLSLTLAGTARLATMVAFAALELVSATFIATAALVVGAAATIAAGTVFVAIGGSALATSPISLPAFLIWKIRQLESENAFLRNALNNSGGLPQGQVEEIADSGQEEALENRRLKKTPYQPVPAPTTTLDEEEQEVEEQQDNSPSTSTVTEEKDGSEFDIGPRSETHESSTWRENLTAAFGFFLGASG